MELYKDFRPSAVDSAGLGLPDQQNWLVAPVSRTRDSDALSESNFETFLDALGGESETVQVHRFGHWGPGWFEIILIDPADVDRVREAERLEAALADYPVLSDEDFSEREMEEADRVWRDCYSERERVTYIRENPNQFNFRSFADLMGCVRGNFFGGWASELLA
jgi:hypothetical protein